MLVHRRYDNKSESDPTQRVTAVGPAVKTPLTQSKPSRTRQSHGEQNRLLALLTGNEICLSSCGWHRNRHYRTMRYHTTVVTMAIASCIASARKAPKLLKGSHAPKNLLKTPGSARKKHQMVKTSILGHAAPGLRFSPDILWLPAAARVFIGRSDRYSTVAAAVSTVVLVLLTPTKFPSSPNQAPPS